MSLKTVLVQFKENAGYSPKTYSYLTDLPVEVGNLAIVDTPHSGFSCVEIMEIHDIIGSRATKHLVAVVDLSDYKARLEASKRKTALEAELKQRLKGVEQLMQFQMLAKMDPAAAALLEEYQAIAA